MLERYKFDIIFGECYWRVRPLGLHDWAFDRHVIDLAVVLSFMSFVFEILVGAFGDCVDGSKGWEIGALLGRL
jgi:hypothetical protein